MKEVNCMKTKKFIVLLMAMVFTLGVVGLSFSAQEIKGTVSKIEGNKLTILDDMGKEKTVKVKDLESLKDLKVGDRVLVKDGKVTKEGT
jgi:outer membrane lipoprotein SlyB